MRRVTCVTIFVFALASWTFPQNTASEFEVVSVKPNKSETTNASNGIVRGDRFYSTNVTVIQLLRAAYGVQEFQIAGQPGWANSERFDIEAKIGAGSKSEDWPLMLRALLADRFKLVLHRLSRDAPVYELAVARNGPKLTPADPDKCDRSRSTDGCGFRASPTEIIGTSVSMDQFATRLARSIGGIVLNKTGLTGNFDLKVDWVPDSNVPLPPGASASPAIFAAIQEQLGLRLESAKAPVETLVVDKVERPSDN